MNDDDRVDLECWSCGLGQRVPYDEPGVGWWDGHVHHCEECGSPSMWSCDVESGYWTALEP
jgi:hypothetical protein